MDGQRLGRVLARSALSSGEFYFDYAANKIFLANNPAGHLIEGAIASSAFKSKATNVTLDHLTIQEFANAAGVGGAVTGGKRWTVQNSVIRLNHGRGVFVKGGGSRVLDSSITHNGQLGIGGTGLGVLVANNEIAYNNDLHYATGWSAGGFKLGGAFSPVIRNNYVHDNEGNGLWCDANTRDALIEGNRVVNNRKQGIQLEISYNGTIRNNVVSGNGFGRKGGAGYGAGIMLSSSGGTGRAAADTIEISGNTVTDNLNGITLSQQKRGSGPLGPHLVQNVLVHNNTVTMRTGRSGVFSGDLASFTTRNNQFVANRYFTSPQNLRWWNWRSGAITWNQWRSYGHDAGGSVTTG